MQVLNVSHFESIKDVIECISCIPEYSKMVEAFQAEVARRKETRQQQQKKRANAVKISQLDAWKYSAEREHIRIGSEYQCRSLARSGTYERGEAEQYM